MNIFQEIKKIIKENYPSIKENINLDTVLGKIEYLDSLDLVTIAVQLEEKYQIRFPDEQYEKIKDKTVKDIIAIIEELIAEQKRK